MPTVNFSKLEKNARVLIDSLTPILDNSVKEGVKDLNYVLSELRSAQYSQEAQRNRVTSEIPDWAVVETALRLTAVLFDSSLDITDKGRVKAAFDTLTFIK